jgi:hypothetical protein
MRLHTFGAKIGGLAPYGRKVISADQTISIDPATVAALRRWRGVQDCERELFGNDYYVCDYVHL